MTSFNILIPLNFYIFYVISAKKYYFDAIKSYISIK